MVSAASPPVRLSSPSPPDSEGGVQKPSPNPRWKQASGTVFEPRTRPFVSGVLVRCRSHAKALAGMPDRESRADRPQGTFRRPTSRDP